MARGMAGAESERDLEKAKEDLEWQQQRFEREKAKAEEEGYEYTEEDDYRRWHGGNKSE